MKPCDVCGNEISESSRRCRFCGAQQQRRLKTRGSGSKARVRTVNLEAGLPSVQEGCRCLEAELLKAREDGIQILRIIHGWGSGGSGGKLRDACRASLNQKVAARRIKQFIRGEEYSRAHSTGRELCARFLDLQKYERGDSGNPGITIIVL